MPSKNLGGQALDQYLSWKRGWAGEQLIFAGDVPHLNRTQV